LARRGVLHGTGDITNPDLVRVDGAGPITLRKHDRGDDQLCGVALKVTVA
jgi:hypothetical protein